jgi:DNA-binding winged helix-turn-helix (wHTH) protein
MLASICHQPSQSMSTKSLTCIRSALEQRETSGGNMTIAASKPGQDSPLADGLGPHRTLCRVPREAKGHIEDPQIEEHLSAGTDRINGSAASAILFGPFRLLPSQRLLLDAHKPLRLGSRALDVLIALVERHGELVSKKELMERVWPDTIVEESNLTVQVSALRRALRDGRAGNRYVINVPGRGYSFVAPITLVEGLQPSALAATATKPELPRRRLPTIVGPGGIEKTAVALAVAEGLIDAYEHGVWLIDLASLCHPPLLPSGARRRARVRDSLQRTALQLITALGDKRMLLVLNNCRIQPLASIPPDPKCP